MECQNNYSSTLKLREKWVVVVLMCTVLGFPVSFIGRAPVRKHSWITLN